MKKIIACLYCKINFNQPRKEQKLCSRSCARSYVNSTFKVGEKHHLFKKSKAIRKADDPLKKSARAYIYRGVLSGKISKLPCQVCGNIKSEAHHSDYTKPLSVEWLCRIHHRQADYRDGTKRGDFVSKRPSRTLT